MINGRRIFVIVPAYNAELTLKKTYDEIPHDIVDSIILVDDCSQDATVEIAHKLGLHTILRHDINRGYGGNQKSCYAAALAQGADIVVMLHPDYQYTPRLIRAMVSVIAEDVYDVVLGSRILGGGALRGGMPRYKYLANRFLTIVENVMIGAKLSEYHTGFRAFSRTVLANLDLSHNSDDFIFDNEMLVQCVAANFKIAEITCPTKYFPEASSINFRRSVTYGFGCLLVALKFVLHKHGFIKDIRFAAPEREPSIMEVAV